MEPIEQLERRIAKLEGDLRFWRKTTLCFGAIVILSGVMGAVANPPDLLTARRLVLRDGDSKARIVLEAGDKYPKISLFDEDGNARVRLVQGVLSGMYLLPPKGEGPQASFVLHEKSGAVVNLFDEENRSRAAMAATGGPNIVVRDAAGRPIFKVPE